MQETPGLPASVNVEELARCVQGVVLRMHQQFAAGPHLPDRFSFYKGMGSGLGSGMVQAVAQHFNFQLAPVPKPVAKKRGSSTPERGQKEAVSPCRPHTAMMPASGSALFDPIDQITTDGYGPHLVKPMISEMVQPECSDLTVHDDTATGWSPSRNAGLESHVSAQTSSEHLCLHNCGYTSASGSALFDPITTDRYGPHLVQPMISEMVQRECNDLVPERLTAQDDATTEWNPSRNSGLESHLGAQDGVAQLEAAPAEPRAVKVINLSFTLFLLASLGMLPVHGTLHASDILRTSHDISDMP